MTRLVAVNAALCAALGLAVLAGAEAWLRITVPPYPSESIYEYTLATPRYKVMRPNARLAAWGEELRTNELGFRDQRDAIPPKRPGEVRIAVVGDSFTVSAGVAYPKIWTSLLERDLAPARVVNLGVGGYNIVQYRMVMDEVALKLQPDLILVAVFPDNDFTNETLDENHRRALGEPAPAAHWYEGLYIYRAYGSRAESWLKKFSRAKNKESKGDPKTAAWNENTEALLAMAAEAKERKIPFAVVSLPHTWHFERQRPLFDRFHAFCRAQALPCLNLLEPFIASGVSEAALRLNALDAHPSAAYDAMVARFISPYVADFLRARNQAAL